MKIEKTVSLTESVYRAMRADLRAGRLNSGAQLKTAQLADCYGVSLAAVREALTRLSSEGLVDAEPMRGFRAARLSAERLQDITEARIEIERLCIEKSIANFDLLQDVRVDHAMERLIATASFDADGYHVVTEDWSEAHFAFHDALMAGCRNSILMKLRRELFDQAAPFRLLSSCIRHKAGALEEEHRPIVEAVHAREAGKAGNLIVSHVRNASLALLASNFMVNDSKLN